MERYAKAASALENGMVVEEGDVEDQEHEIELGKSDYTLFCRSVITRRTFLSLGSWRP